MSIVREEYNLYELAGITNISFSSADVLAMLQQIADWINAELADYFTAVVRVEGSATNLDLYDRTGRGGIALTGYGNNQNRLVKTIYKNGSAVKEASTIGMSYDEAVSLRLVLYIGNDCYAYGLEYGVSGNRTKRINNICDKIDGEYHTVFSPHNKIDLIYVNSINTTAYSYNAGIFGSDDKCFLAPFLSNCGFMKHIYFGCGYYVAAGVPYSLNGINCVNMSRQSGNNWLVMIEGN